MAMTTDVLRGYTDSIILHQLSLGDSYGYAIAKAVASLSGGALEMKEATLYMAFRRMEQAGLIRSCWGDQQTGARRRYYAITPEGRERLRQEQSAWAETKAVLDALLGGMTDEPHD